jgi:hypothetical protein
MGAYFPKKYSLRIVFYFSIGQNYSPESFDVFLSLQKILGIGKVKLEFGSKDVPHIRYTITNREDIFNIAIPYFLLLYGQKSKNIVILKRINKLLISSLEYSELNKDYISEIIHLVYYINPFSQNRKLSLT